MKYKVIVNMKNKPLVSCEINAGDIKEAAAVVRRKYSNHRGFEIKCLN